MVQPPTSDNNDGRGVERCRRFNSGLDIDEAPVQGCNVVRMANFSFLHCAKEVSSRGSPTTALRGSWHNNSATLTSHNGARSAPNSVTRR